MNAKILFNRICPGYIKPKIGDKRDCTKEGFC